LDDVPRLSRAQLALLDRLATEEYGLPVAVLMENAGRNAAEVILGRALARGEADGDARKRPPGRVVVLAGSGNNGGDAFVVARYLANAGSTVEVFTTGRRRSGASRASRPCESMRIAVERMGLPLVEVEAEDRAEAGETSPSLESLRASLRSADLAVDGLLGTGFRGPVRPGLARVIDLVNEARRTQGVPVVALDLPSGLDADVGEPGDPTIEADLTISFAARKLGFEAPAARPHLGIVVVVPIGVSEDLLRRVGRVSQAPHT
jgi:NAD(P)H-hydrate epimerase